MSATFTTFGGSGCFWYRTFLPARATQSGIVQRVSDETEELVVPGVIEQPDDADIIVYHLPWRDWQEEELVTLKDQGKKVIADIDDSLWAVTDTAHPYAEFFAERLERHERLVNMCDAITASTEYLAEELAGRFDLPVYLAENGMDPWRFNIPRAKRSERFVVGWAGGIGHHEAWELVGEQLAQFLRDTPRAVLLVVGQMPPEGVGLDDDDVQAQCQHVPWTDMKGYVPWLCRFNVGLAPSCDTPFYHAKSPLRLLEYQAAGVPSLCSPTTYGEHVLDGATGLIVGDDEWYDTLCRIYDDNRLRDRIGRHGRKHLLEHSTINHTAPQWLAAINSLR